MEPAEAPGQPGNPFVEGTNTPANPPPPPHSPGTAGSPQVDGGTCATCGGNPNGAEMTTYAYVFALGRVEPRFPRLAIEKEFAQATGRAETAGLTDRQALQAVLSQRPNRYLARQLCWVLTIEGLDTYILQPRDPGDIEILIEALRPTPRPTDVDVVIGMR